MVKRAEILELRGSAEQRAAAPLQIEFALQFEHHQAQI